MTKGRPLLADIATYAAYAVVAILFGGPLLWLLSLAIRLPEEVYVSSLRVVPDNPTLANFGAVLGSGRFQTYLRNSVVLSAFGTLGALLCALPAAYTVTKMRFRGRSAFMLALLTLQMVAPLVIMIPLYRFLAAVNLLDSTPVGILTYTAILLPISAWMLRGFFVGVPREIEEAAWVDGCTRFGSFLRIVLPLMKSGIAAVGAIAAILAWGEFVIPFILFSRPDQQPLSVGVLTFQGSYSQTSVQILAAAGVLTIVPIMIIFVLLQRHIVEALTSSGLKG